ncbi:MAG: hypothetical protein COA38_13040 [Fluviicola sp.]|nr:MAG: hypothetical protein COA38_13040 [Fluviicola sp.]
MCGPYESIEPSTPIYMPFVLLVITKLVVGDETEITFVFLEKSVEPWISFNLAPSLRLILVVLTDALVRH